LIEVRNRIFRKQPEQTSARHSVSAPIPVWKLICSEQPGLMIFARLQVSELPQVLKLTCFVQPVLIFARLQVSELSQVLKLTCSVQPMAVISEQ